MNITVTGKISSSDVSSTYLYRSTHMPTHNTTQQDKNKAKKKKKGPNQRPRRTLARSRRPLWLGFEVKADEDLGQ